MKSTSLWSRVTWNQHFHLFRPEINIFELIRCVKLTFCCFLSEINILAVTRYVKSTYKPEINIRGYALREIDILLVSKWNKHPCRHALTRNQHLNLFWPKINIFELIHLRCVKLTFCWSLSETNILAVTRSREINILTYRDLKSTFLSLCVSWNYHFQEPIMGSYHFAVF